MEVPKALEGWSWIAGIVSAMLAVGAAAWQIWVTTCRHKAKGDWEVLDRAFHGVRIGARFATLESLDGHQIAREGDGPIKMTKRRLPTGNELSVTYDSEQDRILYAELDWCSKAGLAETAIAGLKFGKATLEQIRRKFGSNGFSYVNHMFFFTPEGLVTFNAFELRRTPSVVVVFVSLLRDASSISTPSNGEPLPGQVGNLFHLVAVAVADESYLDKIWGSKKVYDPQSKPIELDASGDA